MKEIIDILLLSRAFGGSKPDTVDIFMAYDIASFEGFEYFGIDAFNDVMATVAGRYFAELVVAAEKAGAALDSSDKLGSALNLAFSAGRLDFQGSPVFSNIEKVKESFFSVMMAQKLNKDTRQFEFVPIVLTRWIGGDVTEEKATLWKSTIGIFLRKNLSGILRNPGDRENFLKRVESHLQATESTNWEQPITNAAGESVIVSDKLDILALHQMIEILSLFEKPNGE